MESNDNIFKWIRAIIFVIGIFVIKKVVDLLGDISFKMEESLGPSAFPIISIITVFVLGGIIVVLYLINKDKNKDDISTQGSQQIQQQQSKTLGTEISIDRMTGIQFENYCATLLKNGGFQGVKVTQQSGDYGADIIANDYNGNTWAIQCKRYDSVLGLQPIQEVLASMSIYGANKAAVITNSRFTASAKKLAQSNGVSLIDGSKVGRKGELSLNDFLNYTLL